MVQSLGHQSHVAVSRPRSKGPIFHVFQPVKFQWQWTCTRPHSELIIAYSLILYHIMRCLSMARRHSDFSVHVSSTSFSALWNILEPTVFSRHRIVVRRQMNRTQTPGASSFINAVSTGARTSLVKIMSNVVVLRQLTWKWRMTKSAQEKAVFPCGKLGSIMIYLFRTISSSISSDTFRSSNGGFLSHGGTPVHHPFYEDFPLYINIYKPFILRIPHLL